MSFRNFIEQLRLDQSLYVINDSYSPYLDVSGLAHKMKGPVLFNDVMGHKIVINIIANRQCMAAALGTTTEKMVHYLAEKEPDLLFYVLILILPDKENNYH